MATDANLAKMTHDATFKWTQSTVDQSTRSGIWEPSWWTDVSWTELACFCFAFFFFALSHPCDYRERERERSIVGFLCKSSDRWRFTPVMDAAPLVMQLYSHKVQRLYEQWRTVNSLRYVRCCFASGPTWYDNNMIITTTGHKQEAST